ncbi:MAG: CvpA family protein [Planctomycetota bacterium]
MTIETYDMVMLAVLLIATAIGAWKGLVWQVASLVSLFASYWVAYEFRDACAAYLPLDSPWNVLLAMLGLFVLTLLLIWIVFRWLSTFIDRLKLKAFDRQLGALLGFAKGMVLCVIITLLAVTVLGDEGRRPIAQSKSGFLVSIILDQSPELLPAEIQEMVRPYLDVVNERLEASAEAAEQGG